MRISDWSSDVCSSDLQRHSGSGRLRFRHHGNDRLDQTRQSRTRGKVTDQNSSSSLRSRRSNGGACACSLKFARLHHLVLAESRKRVRRTPITPSSIRFENAPFRSEDTPSGASEQTRRNKKWTTTQFSKSPTLPGRGYSKAFLTRFWIASMKSPEVNSSSIYRML